MQTLGLSDSTPRSEGRLRALFWPTIRNGGDFEYITRQGFWICFLVGTSTIAISGFAGQLLAGMFEGSFYILAGVGVRERSRVAAIVAFAAYLLDSLVVQRYTANAFSFLRLVCLALLFANIRGSWISARWTNETESRLLAASRMNQTLLDKLVDQMPPVIWPTARFVLYAFAFVEILLLLVSLFAPRG